MARKRRMVQQELPAITTAPVEAEEPTANLGPWDIVVHTLYEKLQSLEFFQQGIGGPVAARLDIEIATLKAAIVERQKKVLDKLV